MNANKSGSRLDLLAPLSGVLVPLTAVPDPVFAQKMVGDGVAIDPTSAELLAPADGTVAQLHPAAHALTLVADGGLEVLLHIGLDTVHLDGEGFRPLVREGARVRAGEPLVSFDPAVLAAGARSLLTQMVVTNPERVASLRAATGLAEAGRSVALSVELAGGRAATPAVVEPRVPVRADARSAREVADALAAGAEGVGLLRCEGLFDGRYVAPSEEELAAQHRAVARAVGRERPLVIRATDGAPARPGPAVREANPLLGMRGLRAALERPEALQAQLRSILRAAPFGFVQVLFPLVSTPEELRAARAHLAAQAGACGCEPVRAGAEIATPGAAVMAAELARECDFLAIEADELAQYCLAMDRGHAALGAKVDALHPAVLRLVRLALEGAHGQGRRVTLAGAPAADPLAAPLLAGLGVDELAVPVRAIGPVRAALARLPREACRALAGEALELGTAGEVRARLAAAAA